MSKKITAAVKHKTAPIAAQRFKAVGDEFTGLVEGYASVFGNVDAAGDVVLPTAFDRYLKSGRTPYVFFEHIPKRDEMAARIGRIVELKKDDYGLRCVIQLDLGHPIVANLKSSILGGLIEGFSIGYTVVASTPSGIARGERLADIELFEISIVQHPCNSLATISSAKSIEITVEIGDDEGEGCGDAVEPLKALGATTPATDPNEAAVGPSGDAAGPPGDSPAPAIVLTEDIFYALRLCGLPLTDENIRKLQADLHKAVE